MGKKTRKERQQRRESFAVKQKAKKRKNTLIATGAMAAVAAVVGYAVFIFVTTPTSASGIPPGAGPLNDEHEHAALLVVIHGDVFDFSGAVFQLQNNWIHFESQDGTTIHRHASGVTMGYLFETLNITVDEQCYVFPNGREFCTDDNFSLKYYINKEQVQSISDHVLQDGDRILISYGGEDPEEIQRQLDQLDSLPIVA